MLHIELKKWIQILKLGEIMAGVNICKQPRVVMVTGDLHTLTGAVV